MAPDPGATRTVGCNLAKTASPPTLQPTDGWPVKSPLSATKNERANSQPAAPLFTTDGVTARVQHAVDKGRHADRMICGLRVCQNEECKLIQNRDRTGALNIGVQFERLLQGQGPIRSMTKEEKELHLLPNTQNLYYK